MHNRIDLDNVLRAIIAPGKVYYQPPSSIKIEYPCIIYGISTGIVRHANNAPYSYKKRYQVTLISKNPDDLVHDKIAKLSGCRFDRRFISDNLYHDNFVIYI